MKQFLISLTLLFAVTAAVFADLPFRKHRASVFEVLPVHSDNIVFVGNSITQGNEWWEAFNNPLILNRGISGALSGEVLENLPHFIKGNPKKLFLKIGTNNGAEASVVIPDITACIEMIKRDSPQTEIYIASILPTRRNNDEQKNINVQTTNQLIKELCDASGVTYIDLWSHFIQPGTNRMNPDYSNDGLHLLASGYRLWCDIIAPYVGNSAVYPQDAVNQTIATPQYPSQRASDFAMLPVHEGDILMIGDLWVNTGEWRELFANNRVKSRGIGVGYPSYYLKTFAESIPCILDGRADNGKPAKVFLQAGTTDAVQGASPSDMKVTYQAMIDSIGKYSPATRIYIQSLLPHHTKEVNEENFAPFNKILEELAQENNATFIDIYTPFVTQEGVCDATYFNDMYLYGNGYLKLVEQLSPYVNE